MKNSKKANSAEAKNSANTNYKVFNVHNHITDSILPHRLPLNKETESLPQRISHKQREAIREKYENPAKVTKKTYDSLRNKVSISHRELETIIKQLKKAPVCTIKGKGG